MGFAFTASYAQCDRSLVHYLSAPVRGLGIFLIPVCTVITFFVNIAIPSAAGCAAAVGSTLIPVMLRAGIKPAAAAAAVEVGSSDGVYFYGENVCVVTDSAADLYIIQPDKL